MKIKQYMMVIIYYLIGKYLFIIRSKLLSVHFEFYLTDFFTRVMNNFDKCLINVFLIEIQEIIKYFRLLL